MNIASVLSDRAREASERTALYFEDGRSWSWGTLDRITVTVARLLESKGITCGDRVAVAAPNRPEVVALLYGAWRMGAVPVTISSLYNREELTKTLEETRPRLVVVTPQTPPVSGWETLCLAPETMKEWESAQLEEPLADPVETKDTDEAVVLFTGGTTGLPKPVVTTHGGTMGAVRKLAAVSKGRPGPYKLAHPDVPPNLLALPLFHSGGQQTLLFAFYVGRPLLLMKKFNAAGVVELVGRYRIDNLFLMPTMVYDLVGLKEPVNLETVRAVLVAGQALDDQLRQRFEKRFGIPIATNYGSTETGHVAGWTRADLVAGRWKPGSAGRVYDGVSLEIRDEDGGVLTLGEVGEICVQSDLAKGYLGEREDSGKLVRDGWVHSGDMGYLDDDGVLFLVGRKRDMIKTGGFQVWPAELEEALRSHPAVADVAVIGVADERLGEVPKAFVVASGTVSDGVAAELMEFVRERLAHFKAVRRVEFVSALPRTETAKINRAVLENQFWGGSPDEKE
ncbi:MAG: class I adenylate-forming enzyme family protein [bacterium]|nr:acyl--CoA ligase [Acidimicrobiia bacterium]MCY4649822.1 class I adenylate-forming enzyme family protein [bacterium]